MTPPIYGQLQYSDFTIGVSSSALSLVISAVGKSLIPAPVDILGKLRALRSRIPSSHKVTKWAMDSNGWRSKDFLETIRATKLSITVLDWRSPVEVPAIPDLPRTFDEAWYLALTWALATLLTTDDAVTVLLLLVTTIEEDQAEEKVDLEGAVRDCVDAAKLLVNASPEANDPSDLFHSTADLEQLGSVLIATKGWIGVEERGSVVRHPLPLVHQFAATLQKLGVPAHAMVAVQDGLPSITSDVSLMRSNILMSVESFMLLIRRSLRTFLGSLVRDDANTEPLYEILAHNGCPSSCLTRMYSELGVMISVAETSGAEHHGNAMTTNCYFLPDKTSQDLIGWINVNSRSESTIAGLQYQLAGLYGALRWHQVLFDANPWALASAPATSEPCSSLVSAYFQYTTQYGCAMNFAAINAWFYRISTALGDETPATSHGGRGFLGSSGLVVMRHMYEPTRHVNPLCYERVATLPAALVLERGWPQWTFSTPRSGRISFPDIFTELTSGESITLQAKPCNLRYCYLPQSNRGGAPYLTAIINSRSAVYVDFAKAELSSAGPLDEFALDHYPNPKPNLPKAVGSHPFPSYVITSDAVLQTKLEELALPKTQGTLIVRTNGDEGIRFLLAAYYGRCCPTSYYDDERQLPRKPGQILGNIPSDDVSVSIMGRVLVSID